MKIQCKVSISRRSDDVITISVQDTTSHVEFLELEMTPQAFAFAVTGLGFQEATGSARGLECVGKQRIVEERQVVYPGDGHVRRDAMVAWLEANCQEPGWFLDSYLGSQSSVSRNPTGETVLRYRVLRYVD